MIFFNQGILEDADADFKMKLNRSSGLFRHQAFPSFSGFSVEAGNRRIPPPVKTKVACCSSYEICLCAPFF